MKRCLFLLLSTLMAIHPCDAAQRPDFVVFLTDDHGQLDSSPYGATDVRTPNMQALADKGMIFTHAFIASPSCAPSRSAFLTGLMPARNGAEANHTFKREGIASLPDTLRGLGYETAAFGKVAHGKDVKRHGFDVFDEQNDVGTVEAFLRKRDRNKPLCLFVGSHHPHVPWSENEGYDPAKVKLPPTFADTPETRAFRTRYYTDVTKADSELGAITALARKHLDAKNTVFIYSSDHGAQWPFGKWNLYDSGIRVPLIIAWEGVIKPSSRTDAMVQWIDILPTIIDAAGGKVPAGIDGRSFLPVIRSESAAHRDAIFTTHSGDGHMNVYPIRSIRTADWKLILNLHPEFAHTTHIDKALARDGGRYWISWFEKAKSDPITADVVKRYHERPSLELYDMKADPFELHNLAGEASQAQRVSVLRAKLESWMREQGDEQRVFNEPWLLRDPASTRPGENSATNEPHAPLKKPQR